MLSKTLPPGRMLYSLQHKGMTLSNNGQKEAEGQEQNVASEGKPLGMKKRNRVKQENQNQNKVVYSNK